MEKDTKSSRVKSKTTRKKEKTESPQDKRERTKPHSASKPVEMYDDLYQDINFLPKEWECLDPGQLRDEQSRLILETSELLNLPAETCFQVLSYFKWDSAELQVKYFEDPRSIFKGSGIPDPNRKKARKLKTTQEYSCSICFCDYNGSLLTVLPCGHYFCSECITGYIVNEINSFNSAGVGFQCPDRDCLTTLNHRIVTKILKSQSDQLILKRFEKNYSDSFVAVILFSNHPNNMFHVLLIS
eukprot:TRINITY_DN11085_c0_g1_i1.p1 TRINITY_DN11085_c0_g1~~TRINITY_DN11085_c0_g1_i1.p1  ORF type:complete len:242 (-),score=35.75 TRINITY_DN11085_c0_g1_i1:208-933(-)